MSRQPRISLTEKEHYAFLHEIGMCWVDGSCGEIEVDHMSYNDIALGKVAAGMGQKTHYGWCLPISRERHRMRHTIGLDRFLRQIGTHKWDLRAGPGVLAIGLLGMSALNNLVGAQRLIQENIMARQQNLLERMKDQTLGESEC